jgi:hypothetical protein
MVRRGQDDPVLREHLAACETCRQDAEVAAWMIAFADLPADPAKLPDPGMLWWKAQLLQRWDAQRRATEPIETGQQVQVGIGVAGAGCSTGSGRTCRRGARVTIGDVTSWSRSRRARRVVVGIGGLLAATALMAIGIFAD